MPSDAQISIRPSRCAIAEQVGAVCALPGKLVGDLATAVADLAAVDACPSQRKATGKRHHEVEDCESRIEKRTIEKLLEAA